MKSKRTRRDFLATNTSLATTALISTVVPHVHAGESSLLKIGLIGCGGRGSGAVLDALTVDPQTKLIAACDIFPDRAKASLEGLKTKFGDRIAVTPETLFIGFDAYKKVLATDIDVVILATPQHFRPITLRDAVAAGKHVFAEKPVAIDGAGIKMILAAEETARQKKLNLVSGLVNRYNTANSEIIKRIHDGAIGDIICARSHRMGGPLWKRPRVEGDTEMMYQMRNWVNFNWIASEFINDVTIHQIDMALWAMGDIHPVAAIGTGGRLARRGIDTGDMYDSMSNTFEFEDGRFIQAYSRQVSGTWPDVAAYIYGSKGMATIKASWLKGSGLSGANPFTPEKAKYVGRQYEHKVLLDAIRSGGKTYVNNGSYMANSTMTCILGKLAAYTGKRVTWEEALAYEEAKPSSYAWDAVPPTIPNEQGLYKIAIPHEGWTYLN